MVDVKPVSPAGAEDARRFHISPFQSDLLDLSRWLAALLVVIEHLRSLMFTDYGSGSRMGPMAKAFYFVTDFGHPAVMVFFVMSGFLVGGKVIERLAHGAFSWQKYAVDRSSRLYAVYLLALVLGGVLDHFGYAHFNRFGLYDRSFAGHIAAVNGDLHQNLSGGIFAANLLMCQTVLAPVFGSNGPLWSLANEFWYYLAGPLLFVLLYRRDWRPATASVCALGALFWFLPMGILIYGLVWLMGASLYFINSRKCLPLWCSVILFTASFCLARLQWIKVPFLADFLIGLSFALLINSASCNSRRLPLQSASRKMADFSYSVYLCHFPFLVFALSAIYQATGRGLREQLSFRLLSLSAVILLSAYVWSYLISLVTERQTHRIREWLYRLLGRGKLLAPSTPK